MSNRRYIFAVVFAVIAFVVYSTLTSSEPVELVQIGIMSSGERHVPEDLFQGEYANAEINSYCKENDIPYRFEFVYTNASNNADNAKALTKWYDEIGVDIVIGYNWGSHIDASDYEAKHRGMIMISPSSQMSLHRDIYPHIFQLTPIDLHQAEAVAVALIDFGIDKIAVIRQTGTGWDYLFVPVFNESYTNLGGKIVSLIYTPSASLSAPFNFSLTRVEEAVINASKIHGGDSFAIFATFPYVHPDTFSHISRRPGLMNVTWFGTDWHHIADMINFESQDVVPIIKLLHPVMDRSPYTENPVYGALNDAYIAEFEMNLTRYGGSLYDSCWIAALSVIETGSTLNTTMIESIPKVASEYIGATGECSLDEYGDRRNADYILYEYRDVDGVIKPVETGYYYGSSGKIEWFD